MGRRTAKATIRPDDELALAFVSQPCGEAGTFLAGHIAAENARQIIRRLLEQGGRYDNFLDAGIGELFHRWLLRADPGIEVCWHRAFSSVLSALRGDDEKAVIRAGVALAIHLNVTGEPGAWSAGGAGRQHEQWGAWLLPEYDRISVRTDGGEAILTLDGELRLRFTRDGSQWRPDGIGLEELHRVSIGGQATLLLPRAEVDGYPSGSRPAFLETIGSENALRWRQTGLLIESYAAEFAPWIGGVVRHVALLDPSPGTVYSGSHSDRYGFIFGSDEASIPASAEILVHEASHQYFLILRRLGPLDDGSDTSLYYSPLVDRGRPLDRILFAFHACANILGFYRSCVAAGISDTSYFSKNEPVVVDQLRQLILPLRTSRALTPTGRALFEPWAEIVH